MNSYKISAGAKESRCFLCRKPTKLSLTTKGFGVQGTLYSSNRELIMALCPDCLEKVVSCIKLEGKDD